MREVHPSRRGGCAFFTEITKLYILVRKYLNIVLEYHQFGDMLSSEMYFVIKQ